MARSIRLSKERREALLRYLEERRTEIRSDWREWTDNLARWRKAYRGIVPVKTEPWAGCSNLSVPITPIATERGHSTLLGVLDQDELFEITPTEANDARRVLGIKEFANWAAFQDMKLHDSCDPWFHKVCTYGRAPAFLTWRREQRKVRETFPVLKSEIGRGRDPRKVADYHFRDKKTSVVKQDRETARVKYVEDGRRLEATLRILRDEDRIDPSEDELEFEVERLLLKRDCPVLETPSPEDCLHSLDGLTPYDAEIHMYVTMVTLQELESRRRSGYYEISDELMKELRKGHERQETGDDDFLSTENRTYDSDVASVQTTSAIRRGRFVVEKFFLPWDADGDGEQEECIFTVLWDSSHRPHYLRGDYLENIYPHGERPFIFCDWIFIDDVPTAIGIPETLASMQAEINTLHNQIVDANAARNNPWFAYRSGSSLTPAMLRVRPGQGIPMDDPSSIWMPTFGNSSASDVQTMGMLMEFAERLVPHGDVVMRWGSGGNRTAGGMAMLVQQSQQVWDKYVRRSGRALERVMVQALQLYAANMTRTKEFRVTGRAELSEITRDDLRAGYDFRVQASMLRTNKEIQRAYALQRYQLFAANPLFQSEERQYAIAEDLLRSQEVKNIARYIGPEPDETRHPHLSPEQEMALFAQGIAWEPHADENHEVHLQSHQTWIAMNGHLLTPQAMRLVQLHMEHTERLMSQQQRAAQQQAMGVPRDGASPGADMGQTGGMNGLMNSVQQQPGAMVDAAGGMGV